MLLLPPVLDDLLKEAVVITDTVAAGGDPKARHALQKARRKAAEAAIAERGVGLGAAHPRGIDAEIAERQPDELAASQVADNVVEQAPDQKLERHVIDALAALRAAETVDRQPAMDDAVPQRQCGRDEPVPVGRGCRILSDRQSELGEQRRLEVVDLSIRQRRVANRGRREVVCRIEAGSVLWHSVLYPVDFDCPDRQRGLISRRSLIPTPCAASRTMTRGSPVAKRMPRGRKGE